MENRKLSIFNLTRNEAVEMYRKSLRRQDVLDPVAACIELGRITDQMTRIGFSAKELEAIEIEFLKAQAA